MKFDIFYQLPAARTQRVQDRYRELIDESIEADRLGFDTVWLAEVHFAPRFSTMPTPLLLLAAIGERTTRLRLGTAVNLMPLHHPLRLAEEIATLDVLSGGRVEFGGGRGAFLLNYRGYGVDMVASRALFAENLEFVKRAWTEDRLTIHEVRRACAAPFCFVGRDTLKNDVPSVIRERSLDVEADSGVATVDDRALEIRVCTSRIDPIAVVLHREV